MKSIYIMIVLLTGMFCNAQTFGASALDVKDTYDGGKPVWAMAKAGNFRQGSDGLFPNT